MKANADNFCGGNFTDWLEVLLTSKCNGRCSWCVERDGYHPEHVASVREIAKAICESDKQNIVLLGGEPFLYKELPILVSLIYHRSVYITTNGSLLTPWSIKETPLRLIAGLNISAHHYHAHLNEKITGVKLDERILRHAIDECKKRDISVRLNCNLIKGEVDSLDQILRYVRWAKNIGADKVRFAELKLDEENFVDLAKILNYQYGLNDNPFVDGCNKEAVINGMPVNFRQMCGFQTPKRITPTDPVVCNAKKVLYYDGKMYDGWQKNDNGKGDNVMKGEIRKLIKEELRSVIKEIIREEIEGEIKKEVRNDSPKPTYASGGSCQY